MPATTETSITPDDEIDLLDLLVVIAENLKLLIFAPILIGLTALGISFYLPKTFESQSMLSPAKPGLNVSGQMLASLLKSNDVLEDVANSLNYEPELSKTRRLKKLEKQIFVSVGKQDQFVTVHTHGSTPEAAKALNIALWQQVLPMTIPRDSDMQRLQKQLNTENERLASGEELEKSTAKQLATGTTDTEGTARLYGELLAANSDRLRNIASLEAQIEGLTVKDFAQRATLPEESIKPKKSIIAVAASLASGFLLLIFVFARHALQAGQRNPEQAEKIHKIRSALGLKPLA